MACAGDHLITIPLYEQFCHAAFSEKPAEPVSYQCVLSKILRVFLTLFGQMESFVVWQKLMINRLPRLTSLSFHVKIWMVSLLRAEPLSCSKQEKVCYFVSIWVVNDFAYWFQPTGENINPCGRQPCGWSLQQSKDCVRESQVSQLTLTFNLVSAD